MDEILKELESKAQQVVWFKRKREEHCRLISKRMDEKEMLRGDGSLIYDPEDIEEALKR
ncbi:MAG: hypothetical protein ACE5PM_08735 [Candidatus Hydrothermarchaeales archaeon]